jgi:DNA-binding CsgD family transcriptional regulator
VPLSSPLSRREVQVLLLAALGRTAQKTADRLGVSIETVKHQRKQAIAKLGARNMTNAVAIGLVNDVFHGRKDVAELAGDLAPFLRLGGVGERGPQLIRTGPPIAPSQRARFYAQTDLLDSLLAEKAGSSKEALKAWASEQVGRQIESINDLTYAEASDVLDELRHRVEQLR